MCDWYALCDRPAFGEVDHPVLGNVAVCRDCRDKHELKLAVLYTPEHDKLNLARSNS